MMSSSRVLPAATAATYNNSCAIPVVAVSSKLPIHPRRRRCCSHAAAAASRSSGGLSSSSSLICNKALRLNQQSSVFSRAGATPICAMASDAAAGVSTIAVGDKLPEAELSYFDEEGDVQIVKVSELTKGKKVVLFAVPGAFTPTCSTKHVPGFVEKAEELREAGVQVLACVSINDAFVMRAWGESIGVSGKVLMLSDGLGRFTKALGVTLDMSAKPTQLGIRSRRYSLLAEDGVVKILNLEEGGGFTVSGADDILKSLKGAPVV